MRTRRLEDAGERLSLYHAATWAFLSCSAFAIMVSYYLLATKKIGLPGAIGIILLGWVVAAGITLVSWTASGMAGRALVHTMTAAGNLPQAPSFSLQESLIARGKYPDAERAFEDHLEREPGDFHARLALAALWRDHLGDTGTAERMLLDARRRNPPRNIEFAIGNALIDLYHATGQAGRELSELARFADRFGGTAEGRRARQAIARLMRRRRDGVASLWHPGSGSRAGLGPGRWGRGP